MSGQRSGLRVPLGRPVEFELARDVQAPAFARAAVAEALAPLGLGPGTQQTLMLLVSEVVTNAVLHSDGPRELPIVLGTEAGEEVVRITVSDAGSGFTPRKRDPTSISDGYGLFLLEKAASSWGVECERGTSVWFELPREG
jgi:anti-sigma regulatory factor (Ser/Thr protein kinase)